jgi:peptidase E
MIFGPDLKHLSLVDHSEIVPELTDFTCLGIIKQRILPHFGKDKYADRHAQLQKEWGDQILMLRDTQALVVNGDNIEIVSK